MSADARIRPVRELLSPRVSRHWTGNRGAEAVFDPRFPSLDGKRGSDELTVAISTQAEADWRYAVAEQCAVSGSRWIDLILDPSRGVRLGPMSRRDWSVCTACAERRVSAARTSAPIGAPTTSFDHLSEIAAALLGRELDALTGDLTGTGLLREHVLSLDSAATTLTLHRVIGLPDCRLCPGPAPKPAGPGMATDTVAGVLMRLGGWVDPLTGVIPAIRLDHPLGRGPHVPTIATAAAPRIASGGALRELPIGWGKGLGEAAAVVSAVGEAIERYSASLPDPDKISWCRAAELDGDVLTLDQFPLYPDDKYARPGFPFVRWDPGLIHPWVRGHWYGSDRSVWVPAVLAYLHLKLHPHQHVVQGSSNGLAAGVDHDDAADRAVCELIERDAFLAAWRTGHALLPVNLDTVPPTHQATLAGLRDLGLTVELAMIAGSAGASTVVALGRGDGEHTPGACIGLAASADPARAAGSAILELAQTVPHLTGLMRSGQLPAPGRASDVVTMLDHAAYFFPVERARWFDRLYRPGTPPLDLTELEPVDEANLPNRLRGQGIRVAIVDVTAPDVASGPFRVARAVSPDLMPITVGYGLERLPPERVRGLPLASPRPPVHPVW